MEFPLDPIRDVVSNELMAPAIETPEVPKETIVVCRMAVDEIENCERSRVARTLERERTRREDPEDDVRCRKLASNGPVKGHLCRVHRPIAQGLHAGGVTQQTSRQLRAASAGPHQIGRNVELAAPAAPGQIALDPWRESADIERVERARAFCGTRDCERGALGIRCRDDEP